MSVKHYDRRDFLSFLGIAGATLGTIPACRTTSEKSAAHSSGSSFCESLKSLSLNLTTQDDLALARGLIWLAEFFSAATRILWLGGRSKSIYREC